MKFIDEKGKLFGKINALDLGIVFIVLLLILGTYFKFFALNNTSVVQDMIPIKYEIEIKGSRHLLAEALKEGDLLYDKVSGNSIGKIVGIAERPATQQIQLLDASIKECELPNRFDITLTVEAEAVKRERAYLVNRSYNLIINANREFKTKYANAIGKVINIYE